MTRFGLHAMGSAGDILPMIALAAGLQRSGHGARVAIFAIDGNSYRAVCDAHAVEQQAITASSPLKCTAVRAALASCRNAEQWLKQLLTQIWLTDGNEDQVYRDAVALCRDSDVIVGHAQCYPTTAAAYHCHKPNVPFLSTCETVPDRRCRPNSYLPDLGCRLNRIMWQQHRTISDRPWARELSEFRRRRAIPPDVLPTSTQYSTQLNLLGVSPMFVDRRAGWPEEFVVTGDIRLPELEPTPLDREVCEFLNAGPPPVFMTFGSNADVYPAGNAVTALQLLTGAVQAAGVRAIIQSPLGEDAWKYVSAAQTMKSRVHLSRAVPFETVFPQCSVIVHHAGSGTCHLALRCGVPSVSVPPTPHHEYFAARLETLGAAPPALRLHEATVEKLAELIQHAAAATKYRINASRCRFQIAQEDGCQAAVAALEQHVTHLSP